MNQEMLPVRVGLIGYGFAGKTFHAPLIRATDGLRLVAVASSDPAKVHKDLPEAEVVGDPQQLIMRTDLGLIVIASPNDSHAPLAEAALSAGKHVVVDKPFALDLEQARAVMACAGQHDRLLAVFHNRRWDSDFLGVRQIIESGRLGRVTHFESHFDRFRPAVRSRWREKAGRGSGLWFDLGPHLVDQALQLFGLPNRVQASLATQRTGAETDDWAHVMLDYDPLRVILHGGMMVAGGTNRFTVHGERGSLVKHSADQQEAQLLAGLRPGAPGWGADTDSMLLFDGQAERGSPMTTPAGDQRRFYNGVADAINRRGPNPVPPYQALAVMAVLEAAAQSSATGQALNLVLSPEERSSWNPVTFPAAVC